MAGLIGYKRACGGRKTSGLYELAITEIENITSATLDATGVYTAITMKAGTKFKKYQFEEDEAQYTEAGKFEKGVYSVEQKLTFKLEVMDKDTRSAVEEIADASSCGLAVIIKRPDGSAMLVGWDETVKGERPLRLQTADADTGKAFTDPQGETIVLGRTSAEKARYLTGDTAALIE